jgi:FAD-dependent urate hydroxylase
LTAARCQVAIVGAGPYGLAAAAHLRSAGIETKVFGEAMAFWQQQMPKGMLLISSWGASHIADPHQALTLDAYQAAQDQRLPWPIPLADFINYGCWFQRQVVPDLDRRRVIRIEPASRGFRLSLDDGELLEAHRVVIATGLASFAWRPPTFGGLPASLASHSADHHDLGEFAGQQVIVVGGGQSALTSAALLHEAGAHVEVIVRAPQIHWVQRKLHRSRVLAPLQRLLYAPTDVGPAGLSRIVGLPSLFRRLPSELQQRIAARAIRPAGAPWLRPRLSGVPITTGRAVTSANPVGDCLRLTLDDRTERVADHALLATGYRVDIAGYPFLSEALVSSVRQIHGYPQLGTGFESSVPGLHFIGAAAAMSFGPVMRFVSGTGYTVRALTHRLQASTLADSHPEARIAMALERGQ